MLSNETRVKRIITEIVSHCPEGIGKTKLYKAFWLSHLIYANKNPGFLSDWPVVRMPRGPGIDKGSYLLGSLIDEGFLATSHKYHGPLPETIHQLKAKSEGDLDEAAVAAIKAAAEDILPLTASQCSEISHDASRSWNESKDGAELNIYTDMIPDEEYEHRKKSMREIAAALGAGD